MRRDINGLKGGGIEYGGGPGLALERFNERRSLVGGERHFGEKR